MASYAGSLQTAFSTRAQVQSFQIIQQLPSECTVRILEFFGPDELFLAQRINKCWHTAINVEDQYVWKEQCRRLDIPIIHPEIDQALFLTTQKSWNSRILSLITSYADFPIDYKKLAHVILGRVYICGGTFFQRKEKGTWIPKHDPAESAIPRWGNLDSEPGFFVQVCSRASSGACKQGHRRSSITCLHLGKHWEGTWQDIHPQMPRFPAQFPLRFFLNSDGTYKQKGDTIKLRYAGRTIVLICAGHIVTPEHDSSLSFADGIAIKVEVCIGKNCFSEREVAKAKTEASKLGILDWLTPDD